MSEETKTTVETTDTPDYKALYEQTLSRAETAEAEATKQKNLKDTYAKENADYKRKERERMSDDEQKAVTEAEREAHYKELERRIALSDYNAELDDVSDVKVRNEISELFADGNIIEALKKFKTFRVNDRSELAKSIKDELMKQNPQSNPQTSNPNYKTKDEILAIKDTATRQKAIADNINLFK